MNEGVWEEKWALKASLNSAREDNTRAILCMLEGDGKGEGYSKYETFASDKAPKDEEEKAENDEKTAENDDDEEEQAGATGADSSLPACFGSLESIHGAYHALIGGAGENHMSNVAVAAFDPIFW